MRIAIYGAGSLGTILGAFISKAGVPIELINRNKAHVECLKSTFKLSEEIFVYLLSRSEAKSTLMIFLWADETRSPVRVDP